LYQLARFGLQTGQIDKAIERLLTALNLEPNNKRVICLLAEAYEKSGNKTKAEEFSLKCKI
jgi:Tfp pilus assembly protein PilF